MALVRTRSAQRNLARTIAGVVAQARHVATALTALPASAFSTPTRLDDWDLRLLTGHLLAVQDITTRFLAEETQSRPANLVTVVRSVRARQAEIDELTRGVSGRDPGPRLAQQLRRNVGELASWEDRTIPEVLEGSPPMRALDFLRLTAVEWIVHADDIAHAIGEEIPLERQAMADAVRCMAETLAQANPGGSIEVRVPPFSAVQCGAAGDPTHTRGTPPNVVECEPIVFLRLATGRVRFAETIGHGLSASGSRADISAFLPVL